MHKEAMQKCLKNNLQPIKMAKTQIKIPNKILKKLTFMAEISVLLAITLL